MQHDRRIDQSASAAFMRALPTGSASVSISRQATVGAALLEALRRRVVRDPTGRIILPTGRVNVADVARVLTALDRARRTEGRR